MCYSALVKRRTDKFGELPVHVREQYEQYDKASGENPQRFPPLRDRIFPAAYGPVIHQNEKGDLTSELMRYGAYPPHNIKDQAYSTFNARRDNLDGESQFWKVGFTKHHGFVALEAFYEWVNVKDLLSAGVVTLQEVRQEFERQIEERKAKVLAEGKPHKLTPTEKKDPRFRKIVIQFKPEDDQIMFVPVIWSYSIDDGFDGKDKGFAIITDEPTPEIQNAGHDRCPVIFNQKQILIWVNPRAMSEKGFIEFLLAEKRLTFKHGLAKAA